MRIWYQRAEEVNRALPTALAGGAVTHVLLRSLHPRQVTDERREMLAHNMAVCRAANVPVIYSEHLYPVIDEQMDLFDAGYLHDRIATIHAEAGRLGASCAGLDTEFYAGSLKEDYRDRPLAIEEWKRLANAVWSVMQKVPPVGFVYPVAIAMPGHAYDVLRGLGVRGICEHYYDQNYFRLPYEVRGLYVRPLKEFEGRRYFTPEEVREMRDVMIWTGNAENALAVAEAWM